MSATTIIPSILYKYIKLEYALTTLQDLKLKITPPNEFDDPLEFLLRVEGNMQRSRIKKMMKSREHERKVYEEAKVQKVFTGSFKEFKRKFRSEREKNLNDAMSKVPLVVSEYLKQPYQAEISKRYGVLCLTEVPDSLLMWSHYASGHRGIVLGLQIPAHWKLHKVDYTKERVQINLGWEENDKTVLAMFEKLVRSKGQDWAYEKEWRAISQLEKTERIVQGGKVNYFVSIKPAIVKEIIIGQRLPEQYVAVVRTLCRHRYAQARLLQATLEENRFGLVIKEVPLDS